MEKPWVIKQHILGEKGLLEKNKSQTKFLQQKVKKANGAKWTNKGNQTDFTLLEK